MASKAVEMRAVLSKFANSAGDEWSIHGNDPIEKLWFEITDLLNVAVTRLEEIEAIEKGETN